VDKTGTISVVALGPNRPNGPARSFHALSVSRGLPCPHALAGPFKRVAGHSTLRLPSRARRGQGWGWVAIIGLDRRGRGAGGHRRVDVPPPPAGPGRQRFQRPRPVIHLHVVAGFACGLTGSKETAGWALRRWWQHPGLPVATRTSPGTRGVVRAGGEHSPPVGQEFAWRDNGQGRHSRRHRAEVPHPALRVTLKLRPPGRGPPPGRGSACGEDARVEWPRPARSQVSPAGSPLHVALRGTGRGRNSTSRVEGDGGDHLGRLGRDRAGGRTSDSA